MLDDSTVPNYVLFGQKDIRDKPKAKTKCGSMPRLRTTIGISSTAVVIAGILVVAAIGMLVLANQVDTGGPGGAAQVVTNLSSSANSTSTGSSVVSPVPEGGVPSPLLGELSATGVSCSLATGVCTITLANDSPAPLQLESCDMLGIANVTTTTVTYSASTEQATTTYVTFGNGSTYTVVSTPSNTIVVASAAAQTVTEYLNVNGTIGGPGAAGIPADSQVTATCTVPVAQFAYQTEGSLASGGFRVMLVGSADSYPAGTETSVGFQGTWS
jgi:hypothetical protein